MSGKIIAYKGADSKPLSLYSTVKVSDTLTFNLAKCEFVNENGSTNNIEVLEENHVSPFC